MAYLMGCDIGSSSVKVSILDDQGSAVGSAFSPETEMRINAPEPGMAEQDPVRWWEHLKKAAKMVRAQTGIDFQEIRAIGISYQMHGLVCVDEKQKVLRPSIIWCDSRAVGQGERAGQTIGEERCLKRLFNLPGNFTASKLAWVRENEPDIFRQIDKVMLPGDYIAMRMTGDVRITTSGLSEGIFWDFEDRKPSADILNACAIPEEMLAQRVDLFSVQGELTADAADDLGMRAGTPVAYRAGDQPNNAFSLNVLAPGELAVTAGTSGVVYGVVSSVCHDPRSRVNVFAHVNYTEAKPVYGVLLCLNGTGILNSWMRRNFSAGGSDLSYEDMNQLAADVAPGSDGLLTIPFGNGAERVLENRNIGASLYGLDLNIHERGHVFRSAQEGIIFGFRYGMEIMETMGLESRVLRAGHANMFLSPVFQQAFASATDTVLHLYKTDGAAGAARGAGVGAGVFADFREAFSGLEVIRTIEPNVEEQKIYADVYEIWKQTLNKEIQNG